MNQCVVTACALHKYVCKTLKNDLAVGFSEFSYYCLISLKYDIALQKWQFMTDMAGTLSFLQMNRKFHTFV